MDLARGNKDARGLLAVLHDAACKELEQWGETDVDGVAFRDDWGTPQGLLIAPEMWREIFRPLYRKGELAQVLMTFSPSAALMITAQGLSGAAASVAAPSHRTALSSSPIAAAARATTVAIVEDRWSG